MCVRNKLGNGATYGCEILHADPGRARVTHGLGLMSMGAIIRRKIYVFKTALCALLLTAANSRDGWLDSGYEPAGLRVGLLL